MALVRTVLLTAALLAMAGAAGWEQKVGFELLLNQGYYSSNWQGDERTSGSLTATLGHRAQNQLARVVRFEHDMGLAFGEQVREQDSAAGGGWEVSKSEDKVSSDELVRFTLGGWVDPLAGLQLRSQFIDTRDSNTLFLNPLQLMEMVGGGRKFYDDSTRTLTSELGAAARQLWDAKNPLVADAGISWITKFRTKVLTDNASYSSRLTAYKPLIAMGSGTEIGKWPQVDWEHELSARFNKALSGKVYVQLLYDELVAERPRLKQTLGMGLSLAWPSN
jgi:hypothetical protein